MNKSEYRNPPAVETDIQAVGGSLWRQLSQDTPGVFDRKYWQGILLDWVMRDPAFKVDLLRFVDLFPSLTSEAQVAEYVQSYLLREGRQLPKLLAMGLQLFNNKLTAKLAANTLRQNILGMAGTFIVGTEIADALPKLEKLHGQGLAFTADLLGEKTISEEEAELYRQRYWQLIDTLAAAVPTWSAAPLAILGQDHLGPIPVANISLKVTALDSQIESADLSGSVARLANKILPLLLHAKKNNVFVNFDLEQWEYHHLTYRLFEELLLHPELKDWPHLGIVVQAYLRIAEADVEFLAALANRRQCPLTVRLVKGAYWDYEVTHARQLGLAPPVWLHKRQSDANYEKLSARLLRQPLLRPAFASHNIRSLLVAIKLAEAAKVPKLAFELQMLSGMAEPIREHFRSQGYRVRLYSPIGEFLPGIAYLVRRLLENTSNSGFLRQSFYEAREIAELLRSPHGPEGEPPAPETRAPEPRFRNTSPIDFVDPAQSESFRQAVAAVRASLPLAVPVVVNGQVVTGLPTRERYSPNRNTLLVSRTAQADRGTATAAVTAASTAWPAWRDRPLAERCELLLRLAAGLEKDRFRMAALQTIEVGKPWREADGDVAEAIDFCRYYAAQAPLELGVQELGALAGEENRLWYEGRGPALIVAPWNFPLAILCGMTVAALVAGNTVIIKPSNLSTATAYLFYQALRQAGCEDGVVQFLPGSGAEVGALVVDHPQVALIAFTGSKEVGLGIIQRAGVTPPGQRQVKRVVCEMGGKNATIVDSDADLDAAVAGVVKGAFGYAGQKCSATSRVIVLRAVYPQFVRRLTAAIASLTIGSAEEAGCRLGPVIDRQAWERLTKVVTEAPATATVLYRGQVPEDGCFIPPLLVEVNDPGHPLLQEELFGPILTLIQADNFDQALALAQESEFALTGAVFSRNLNHLAQARRQFRVGNLYINRESTGAMVGRQPFGGFGMSGKGGKAGGPGYLRLFADARCVTENTMRQGFCATDFADNGFANSDAPQV